MSDMSKSQWRVTAMEEHAAWWDLVPYIGFFICLIKQREGLYLLSIEEVGGTGKKRVLSNAFKNPGDLVAEGEWIKSCSNEAHDDTGVHILPTTPAKPLCGRQPEQIA